MKQFALLAVLMCSAVLVNAQLKATIIDSATQKGIDKVVVGLVIKNNSTDTTYHFADANGVVSISPVPSSNFSIVVRHLGYQPVAKFIPVLQALKSLDLGTIALNSRYKELEGVVVTAPPILIKEDTIEYRADAFKVKEGAVVEDLLKKLPGIEVDKQGNVKAQGKAVTKVRVNGKDFFGGDVQTATKELPSNLVDKIQIIDDYGDQANVSGIKEGESEKVLNIQLKKDKNQGFFGRATLGYGTEDRYNASFNGNVFKNNSQISVFVNNNNTNQSLFNFGGFGGNRGMGSMMRAGQSMVNEAGGAGNLTGVMNSGGGSLITGGQGNNSGISNTNSIGINYRDQWSKRISVYGNYSYSRRNNDAISATSQQNIFTDTSFVNNQNNNNNTLSNNHRINFNFEYQIDSFNYLKINPNLSFADSKSNNSSLFDFFQQTKSNTVKSSDGSNINQSNSSTPNLSASVLYNHKFKKRGRNFSANLNYGNSQQSSEQDSRNTTNFLLNPVNTFNQFQYINQENRNYNYGVRMTFSEPLSKTRSLDLSYSHNLNYSRNDKGTFNVNPTTLLRTFIAPLSNDFENEFYNNRIGASIRSTFKKYNYTLGISAQPVSLQGTSITKDSAYKTQNRFNLFPIARFAYNFSRSKAFNFSYNGNATQPTFTQLQDVLDISNRQYQSVGNPNLKPAINHTVNMSFNNFNFVTGKVLFATLNLSTIKNQIVNSSTRLGNSGAQLTKPENVNGYYNVLGLASYSKPYKNRKYIITLNSSANYNHNVNLIDNNKIIGHNWIVSQTAVFEYNIKDWFTLGTGATYSLNQANYEGSGNSNGLLNTSSNAWVLSNNLVMDIKKTWTLKYDFDYTINNGLAAGVSQNLAIMNASIERQLFKKKNGVIRLSAFDLFNQNTSVNRNVNANSIIDTRSNLLTRYFMCTFIWRVQKFVGQRPQGGGGFRGQQGGGQEIRIMQ